MSIGGIERPNLPEYMTWEELERLPEEITEQIELWNGRVVWVRRGPAEHQTFTLRLTTAIERCARTAIPDGVHPLHTANYLLTGEWTHSDPNGIEIDFPFPIRVPWSELEF